MEEEDTFLLSFADALTCVFGASVALFLIFVVLVKLAPVEPGPAEEITDASNIGTAIDTLASRGTGAAILHVLGASCHDIRGLSIAAAAQSWLITDRTSDGSESCARVFELPPQVMSGGTTLRSGAVLRGALEFRLIAGATVWPAAAPLRFRDPLEANCLLVGDIARITRDDTEPVTFLQECGG